MDSETRDTRPTPNDPDGRTAKQMKVFLSWSGEESRALAGILHERLPTVLQFVDPWMSSEDIAKGRRWGAEIGRTLEQTSYCIVCVTPRVQREPWVISRRARSRRLSRGHT